MGVYDGINIELLVSAILALENADECKAFLDDLMTVKEVRDVAQRLEVALYLSKGRKFAEISEKTGASSATISRVNRCYSYGPGGYSTVLERVAGKGEES